MLIMETERLIVRNFKPEDWKDLYEYLSQKEVLKYEPDDESSELECREKAIERSEGNIFWAVWLKESDKMIGHLYFSQIDPKEFLTWELGYIFNPLFYGSGYATEACKRILEYGFEHLGACRIFGKCNTENASSWKLLERLSMRREGHFIKKVFFRRTKDGEPIWIDSYEYAILEKEWKERHI